MFDNPVVKYNNAGKDSSSNTPYTQNKFIYALKIGKWKYIVEFEEFPQNIFFVKFYRKKDKNSKRRFNVIYNDYESKFELTKILNVCLSITKEHYGKNNKASFGFIGSSSEKDRDVIRRYSLYSKFATSFFSKDKFEHYTNKEKGVYLLLNKSCNHNLAKIEDIINELI